MVKSNEEYARYYIRIKEKAKDQIKILDRNSLILSKSHIFIDEYNSEDLELWINRLIGWEK